MLDQLRERLTGDLKPALLALFGTVGLALLVALVGAGLLLRSFQRLTQVDLGFRADRLLSAQLTLPSAKYQNYEQVKIFHQRLLPRIAALPGVEDVATIDNFPLTA
jgi:hypothetical protein